jgi:Kae1-associated kinase Bud32
MKNIISQGAEAIISLDKDIILKNRIKKSYRIPVLDNRLRSQRTKREVKILQKASLLISVPKIISSSNDSIQMEYIKGKKLSEHLDSLHNSSLVCKQIGSSLAILHDNNLIHGDLTTSNMLYANKKVYFIDFGLGYESSKVEDKAVDLHLIKEALNAKHHVNAVKFFKAILAGYKKSKNSKQVIARLDVVEKRGRYKQSY